MSSLGDHCFHSLLYAHRQSIQCPGLPTEYILPFFPHLFLCYTLALPHLAQTMSTSDIPFSTKFQLQLSHLSLPTFLSYLLTHAYCVFSLLKTSNALPLPFSQSTSSPIFTSLCVEHGCQSSSVQAFPEKVLNSLTLLYHLHICGAKPKFWIPTIISLSHA